METLVQRMEKKNTWKTGIRIGFLKLKTTYEFYRKF